MPDAPVVSGFKLVNAAFDAALARMPNLIVLFLDEDVPGGGTAYMMQKAVEEQGGYHWLDSEPRTLTAVRRRPLFAPRPPVSETPASRPETQKPRSASRNPRSYSLLPPFETLGPRSVTERLRPAKHQPKSGTSPPPSASLRPRCPPFRSRSWRCESRPWCRKSRRSDDSASRLSLRPRMQGQEPEPASPAAPLRYRAGRVPEPGNSTARSPRILSFCRARYSEPRFGV
jgi:hypothetical protein